MKKLAAGLLALCLLLSACGGETAGEERATDWTVQQMAEAILASQGAPPEMTTLLPGDELYETYLTVSYGLTEEDVADGAILAAGGTSAQEIAVFRLAEDAGGEAAETLETYLVHRVGSFTGYLPEEAALLEDAEVVSQGGYVALLACQDVTAAEDAFERCFTDPPPEDGGEESITPNPSTEVEAPPPLKNRGPWRRNQRPQRKNKRKTRSKVRLQQRKRRKRPRPRSRRPFRRPTRRPPPKRPRTPPGPMTGPGCSPPGPPGTGAAWRRRTRPSWMSARRSSPRWCRRTARTTTRSWRSI